MRICHGQTFDVGGGLVLPLSISGTKKKCFCGGTLVASKYVITAGHCVYEYDDNTDRVTEKLAKHKIYVKIGVYDKTCTCIFDTTCPCKTGLEKNLQIEKIIKHPTHDLEVNDAAIERTVGYDILILKLIQEVDLNIYTPACLTTSSAGDKYVGQMGTAVGWGSTNGKNEAAATSDKPVEVQLEVAELDDCPSSSEEEPSMLCAGMGGGGRIGTCHVSQADILNNNMYYCIIMYCIKPA